MMCACASHMLGSCVCVSLALHPYVRLSNFITSACFHVVPATSIPAGGGHEYQSHHAAQLHRAAVLGHGASGGDELCPSGHRRQEHPRLQPADCQAGGLWTLQGPGGRRLLCR